MEGERPARGSRINGASSRADLSGIRRYMAQHYDESLSIEQLAAMAGLRPKYFVDLFKKTYGQSAMEYLTDVRIGRAKQYLHESDYLLREVARKVGYSDEFYFSRKFKKEAGMSPSAFVKQRKRRIAVCSGAAVGQLLALDMLPVAAPLDSKWTPYYYNHYYSRIATHLRIDLLERQMAECDRLTECDKLIQSQPDAIIDLKPLSPGWQDYLLRNAQTLFIPQKQNNWDGQLREIARYLRRERQCEHWLETFDRKVRLAKARIAAAIGEDTCLVLRLSGDTWYAYSNRGIGDLLYGRLALRPAYHASGVFYNDPLPLEELSRLNPHRLLLLICPDSATRMHWLSLQFGEIWRNLQAVRSNQVFLLGSDPWFECSAISMARMLEETILMFTGKCPNWQEDQLHGYM